MSAKVTGELKTTFKPEFLNRIDATIVFRSLRREDVREIVDLLLNRVRTQLTEQQIELLAPDDAKDKLVEKGYDPQYGARPAATHITNLIEIRWRRACCKASTAPATSSKRSCATTQWSSRCASAARNRW